MFQPQSPANCDDVAEKTHKSAVCIRSERVKRWKTKPPSGIIAGLEAMAIAKNDGVGVVEEGDELDILEATDMSGAQVLARIKDILKTSISGHEEYTFRIPSREKEWQAYSERLGRFVLLKSRTLDSGEVETNLFTRDTRNQRQRKLALCFRELLCVMKELLESSCVESTISLNHVMFGDQDVCDDIIEDVACCVGCKRDNLPVYFDTNDGKIGGMLTYTLAGEDPYTIDCRSPLGWSLPVSSDKFKINNIGAKCIIVVEHHGIFNQLMNAKFFKEIPCVILSGDGLPDIAARKMLRRLWVEFKIPIFALTNCSSYGLLTFLTYVVGSGNLAYDSEDICTPNIKWLGFKPSHLRGTYEIPEDHIHEFSELDCRILSELAWIDRVTTNPDLRKEYEIMVRCREKFEIEELNFHGFSYFDFYVIDQLDRVTNELSVDMDLELVDEERVQKLSGVDRSI